jgi:hypothetical protein
MLSVVNKEKAMLWIKAKYFMVYKYKEHNENKVFDQLKHLNL